MSFGVRIREARKKAGFSADELAKQLKIDRSTLYRYESDAIRHLPVELVEKLAKALGVEPGCLMGWESAEDMRDLPRNALPVKLRKIPLLGGIAAGAPIYAEEEHSAYALVDEDIHADFALRVEGDSMINARILDGDIVFIRRQDDVDDGQIAAVLVDDSATLKRVYHIKGGAMLVSENPKYAPMIFNKANSDTLRILGLAVMCQSRVH